MKKIIKKRIILYCPWTHEEIIGANEYETSLSNESILYSFHEVGKTVWCPTNHDYNELWYLKEQNGLRLPYYKVRIDNFYIEVPTFWDKIRNALR